MESYTFKTLKLQNQQKFHLICNFIEYHLKFVNVTGNFLNTSVLDVFPNVEGVGTTIRTHIKVQ